MQAQKREEERVSDIVHRTVEKDEKLATLRDHRDHVNACKSLEKKLDLDLKREKVRMPLHCTSCYTPCIAEERMKSPLASSHFTEGSLSWTQASLCRKEVCFLSKRHIYQYCTERLASVNS